MSTNRKTMTYDHALLLHDGAVVTGNVAGNIAAVAKVLDLGEGLVEGDIVVDVSAIDVDQGDEAVTIGVEISSVAAFTSDYYRVASLQIGDAAVITGDVDMTTGRYIIPFRNEIANGVQKRYLRLYFNEVGTTTTFDCIAYLVKRSNV
jgi:hypothetical protein